MPVYSLDKLIGEARRLAAEYRRTTGKTLPGISAEIAVSDAIQLLGLERPGDDEVGYDALVHHSGGVTRIQIKGRVIFDEAKRGQRIGQLKLGDAWDAVALVLMDENYEPTEIYQAPRQEIEQALAGTASSGRGKRGALSVAKFKVIGELVWDRWSAGAG